MTSTVMYHDITVTPSPFHMGTVDPDSKLYFGTDQRELFVMCSEGKWQ